LSARIRNAGDFSAGEILLYFGLFVVAAGGNCPMGTALRVGAGYIPIVIGYLLLALGAMLCINRSVVSSKN
jgi:hypothetical protein